jgi:hypothetical protein
MKEHPLRDGLETTLKNVAKEITRRVRGVKPPKSLETPLKQSIEVVQHAVAFGSEMVGKRRSRKKTSRKKTSRKKTSRKKHGAKKTGAKRRGATKRGRTRRAGKKSVR